MSVLIANGRRERMPSLLGDIDELSQDSTSAYNAELGLATLRVKANRIADRYSLPRVKGTSREALCESVTELLRGLEDLNRKSNLTPYSGGLPPLGVFVGRLAAASHDSDRAVTYRVTLHGEDATLANWVLQRQRISPAYQWDVRGDEFIFVGATALHHFLSGLLKVQGKEHDRAVNLVQAALDRLGFSKGV